MPANSFSIYAVSDATGRLAFTLAVAASRQFSGINVEILRKIGVDSREKIREVLEEARARHGVVVFTMVSTARRREMLELAKELGVIAMDLMGPALDMLANYFHTLPSDEPGLQYQRTKDYFKRTEAIEYTVQHDEGQNLETIAHADMILLGISRSTKTPLAIYLAYCGYRCANIPIVRDRPLPKEVAEVDQAKLVGLIPDVARLVDLRVNRLKKLGRPEDEIYAQREHVEAEVDHARELYKAIPGLLVIDITGKAIEELASELIGRKENTLPSLP